MSINKQSYKITGMKQDNLVNTGFSDKFAHEIFNMRLNTVGDYTTGVWTNERSTKSLEVTKWNNYTWITDKTYTQDDVVYNYELSNFTPIGQASINDYWILFGTVVNKDDSDTTNKVNTYSVILCLFCYNDYIYGRILYWGDLNFSPVYPIETLSFYENENIQKVYWTDNLNQPRVINIKGAEDLNDGYPEEYNTQFDFVQEVNLDENVTIEKLPAGNGMFPPCTVKYVLTYYKKYGQETNIVYESPLYYPILNNRGCSPDELSGDSFKITVANLDLNHNFDYIRLYSIIRTSNNGTPIVRIVEDKYIKDLGTDYVEFIDTNTKGSIVDPTVLYYIGGRDIKVETINQKDNTLFLGGITLTSKSITSLLNERIPDTGTTYNSYLNKENLDFFTDIQTFSNSIKKVAMPVNNNTNYAYNNQLTTGNSYTVKQFKKGEYYRVGIQFQDKKGVWSEVIRINNGLRCLAPPIKPMGITKNDDWRLPYLRFALKKELSEYLISNDYKKARLVCCYTTNADRSFIVQGIVNQTVYNTKEASIREEGVPYAAADWFFRPLNNTTPSNDIGPTAPIYNYDLEYKEIQSISGNDSTYRTRNDYWTLNSPDIELDESIRTLDTTNWKMFVSGGLTKGFAYSSIYLDATKGAINSNGNYGRGLIDMTSIQSDLSHIFSFAKWNDADIYYERNGTGGTINYPLFPFQRDTSINNYVKDASWHYDDYGDVSLRQHAKINSKVFSTLGFTNIVPFTDNKPDWGNGFQFFDSNEVLPLIVNNKVYYGNQNTIANVNIDNKQEVEIVRTGEANMSIKITGNYWLRRFDNDGDYTTNFLLGRNVPCADPVSITYKSTPHLVFYGLPTERNFKLNTESYYSYYISDIYREVGEDVRFGGINNRNNIYNPCGPAVSLDADNDIYVCGYEGDHYFMRYDCLKTYPYTNEDTNQIVEILSFPCFSRINLDGRYDRNRGKVDNTAISPTNFNLINKSYTQDNNFFTYTELRDDDIATKIDNFPNQVTWTNTKMSGEEVDTWTSITMASTFDADGTAGKITRIVNQNGKALILFQEHGIAHINYNENTALSTETGLPLELAKTGKFTGLDYITKDFGCQNKWSISQTKNGIMWIDDSRQEIVRYGENIQSFSSLNGFDAFMIQQLPKDYVSWNPLNFDNFVTYYDKLSNDVYYINKDYCLAWNELTSTFTSFYNYENTPYMINLGTHSLMWNNGLWAAREGDDYNKFFGNIKDYWLTIVCDGKTSEGDAFPADKVFNNIEFRADVYNIDEPIGTYNIKPFNTKAAWNGYQFYKEFNDDSIRKFNTWRIQLPRATYKDGNGFLYTNRDRIRNTFCYIKLKQSQTKENQTNRVILHDLAVCFDMK